MTIDYVTGQPRRGKTPNKPAELLIEGGKGSLMMDLRGMGVELHREAFAFRMPDDSLIRENVRAGDVAVIEPCVRELEEGDIVMVALAGVATLRRVTYRGNIAYFQTHSDQENTLTPAWENAFSGVVTAIFRTYYHGRLLPHPGVMASLTPVAKVHKRPGLREPKTLLALAGNRLRDDPPESGYSAPNGR